MAGRPAKAKGTEVLEKSKAKIKAVKKGKPVKIVAANPIVENNKAASDPQADYIKSLQASPDIIEQPEVLINELEEPFADENEPIDSQSEEETQDIVDSDPTPNLLISPESITESQKEELVNVFNSGEIVPHSDKQPNMADILAKYEEKCNQASDINQLLPYLRAVSDVCDHITEFGVRNPTSTYAFLAGNPKHLVSYDIERTPGVTEVEAIAPNFKFVLGSTLEVEIEETDFLFIDTWHTAAQLSAELALHARKVRKYIGFHDIFTFQHRDEAPYYLQPQQVYGDGPGLMAAITPFLAQGEFKIDFQTYQNNGLMILRRINE